LGICNFVALRFSGSVGEAAEKKAVSGGLADYSKYQGFNPWYFDLIWKLQVLAQTVGAFFCRVLACEDRRSTIRFPCRHRGASASRQRTLCSTRSGWHAALSLTV
jgi:hypothetical protein